MARNSHNMTLFLGRSINITGLGVMRPEINIWLVTKILCIIWLCNFSSGLLFLFVIIIFTVLA